MLSVLNSYKIQGFPDSLLLQRNAREKVTEVEWYNTLIISGRPLISQISLKMLTTLQNRAAVEPTSMSD